MFECYVFKALLRRRFGVQMQAELGRRGHRAVGEYGAALATPWSRRRRLEGWVREEAWEKKVHAEKESSCAREGRKKKSCRPHLRLRLPHATPHCCLPSPTIHPPLLHVPFLLLALCCMRALPCSGARGKRLTTQIWEEKSRQFHEPCYEREWCGGSRLTCGYGIEHYWPDGGLRMKLLDMVGWE
jgi:hypothetical protein